MTAAPPVIIKAAPEGHGHDDRALSSKPIRTSSSETLGELAREPEHAPQLSPAGQTVHELDRHVHGHLVLDEDNGELSIDDGPVLVIQQSAPTVIWSLG
jgi:hypothetical protein